MHGFRSTTRFSVAAITAAMVLAACGGSTTPTPTPAGGGGATTAPGATSQAAGGGSVSGLKACSMLTPAEIQTALGAAMKDGVEQDTDSQVECDWNAQDDSGPAVSVSVATYDDAVWQALSQSQAATPISGFGDAAFTGVPHKGDIAIKVKGYDVEVGIVDFTKSDAVIDAAAQALAKLVLSRL